MGILRNFFAIIILALTLFTLASRLPSSILASEGTVELRSTTGQPYRCYAASLLMEDLAYTILITCRDLIYPVDNPRIFTYALWATPKDTSTPVLLGFLGFGKATFRIVQPFSNLFVTTEENPGTPQPTGPVVMRGDVQTISFLERPTSPTPTPKEEERKEEVTEEVPEEEADMARPTTREKLSLAVRRAGLAALFALIALVGLIFVVTRSRG